MKATCLLEENLNSQDLIDSLASTREERCVIDAARNNEDVNLSGFCWICRLELVLVALDDSGALPHSLKIKWAKMINMLPLLAKVSCSRIWRS